MSTLKKPVIGVYGPKIRELQRKLSYEHVGLTWKQCLVYMYLGSRSNVTPATTDIQDYILFETRDRAYNATPVPINVWNQAFAEQQMDFSKFGIIDPAGGNEETFRFHVNSFAADGLGRYILVGDIIQLPFFTQDSKFAFWEVTDVNRKTEFENFYVVVTAVPMDDKQETAEILNKNSQTNILNSLQSGLATAQSAAVPEQGLNPGTAVVTDPSVQGQVVDPRVPPGSTFLDDPNKLPF